MCFLTAPTAPRSLMLEDVTDTTVTLSWMPPDPPNGIIKSYRVQYKRSDRSSYSSIDTMNTDLTYTVTGLTINTEYVFRVRADTLVGRSDPSNVVTALVGKLKYVLLLYIIASDFNLFKKSRIYRLCLLSLIINQVLRIIQIAVKSDVKTGRI